MAARVKRRKNSSSGWIAILLLGIIAFVAVLFGGNLTGFAVLDTGGIWSQNLTVQLEQNVTFLRVSGSMSGTGNATMWLGNRLVYDSRQFTSSFDNVCADTCIVADAMDMLNIIVEGDVLLAITVFNYTEENTTESTETVLIQPIENNSTNETAPVNETTSVNETAPANSTNTSETTAVSGFGDVGIFASGVPPTVDNVTPANWTLFNISAITLSANVTNDTAAYVIANLTYPNSSFVQLLLARQVDTNVHNISYQLPAAGNYIMRIVANDSDNDYNTSVATEFFVDLNFTKIINFTPQFAGFFGGVRNRTDLNSTLSTFLQLNASDKLQELPDNQTDEGLCVAENSLITLADGTQKRITDVKQGDYVLSLNKETGQFVSNKVTALLDMGTKPVYEVTTSSGKQINTTATHPYLVKLIDKQQCEQYENNIWNKQYDEFTGEYCTRWIEVDELEEGMEVGTYTPIRTRTSRVLNTATTDCLLNRGSFDHIPQLRNNANAKYGMSLSCGETDRAFDSYCLYVACGTSSRTSSRTDNIDSTSFGGSFVYFTRSGMLLRNSSSTYEGDTNCTPNLFELSRINLTGLSLKNENTMLASRTSCIYHPASLCLFQTRSLSSSPNLMQSSSVKVECSSALSSLRNSDNLFNLSKRNCRVSSDQLTSLNSSILCFNSAGTDNVMFDINTSPVYTVQTQIFKHSVVFEPIISIIQHATQHVYDLEIENTHNFVANGIVAHNTYVKGFWGTTINMTGNVLLMHFNNDSANGENQTNPKDWSGQKNNGTWLGNGQSNGTAKLGAQSGSFYGSGDFVNVSHNNSVDFGAGVNFTVAVWINTTQVTDIAHHRDNCDGYCYKTLV